MCRASAIFAAALVAASSLCAQSADTVLNRGVEQFHHGEYAAALDTLQQARKLAPADARVSTFLALTRAALGDCAHSVDELKRQAKQAPDRDLRRLAGLAAVQCLLAGNDFDTLSPILWDLRRDYPNDADVLYESAKVFDKAWNAAIYEMFQKTPASYRVNQLSAEIFEKQGKYADAVAEYRKALAKNPKALNLHFRLGRAILLESHRPEALTQARREFEAELALNPSDSAAEYEVGQTLTAEQKPEAAAGHFQKAIDLSPNFPEALVALAKIRASAKQYGQAIPLLERAVQAQPRMEAAHYALMLAYRDAGRMQDAQREKAELDRLQKLPEGEFTDFLKKLGEKAPKQ
jgi:tetratricopeptide (TPR) repeat protein